MAVLTALLATALSACIPNKAPVAVFTPIPNEGAAPLTVRLDASGSHDPDGWLVAYAWAFGDGSRDSGRSTEHRFEAEGTYDVMLTVKDNLGKTATSHAEVTVRGAGAGPTAQLEVADPIGITPHRAELDASGSSGGTPPLSYSSDFGDGNTGTGETATHGYESPGAYTAIVTVTDDAGRTDTASAGPIIVGDSATHPIGLDGEVGNIPAMFEAGFDWQADYAAYAQDKIDLFAGVHGATGRINILMSHGPCMPDVDRYGTEAVEALVAAYQRAGVRVTMTIGYAVEVKNELYPPNWLWTTEAEKAACIEYVRGMIELFDFDGEGDAPGLQAPITIWQIHNELESQWTMAMERSGVYNWATPDDYAELLQTTAPVIRAAMPGATILASHYPVPGHDAYDFDSDGTIEADERAINRVAALGGYAGVDAIEIHDFAGSLTHLIEGIEYARTASGGVPVWVGQFTAASSPVPGQGEASPTWQGQMLVKALTSALVSGADQAHWYTLEDIPPDAPTAGGAVFRYAGLYGWCDTPTTRYGLAGCWEDLELHPSGVAFRELPDAVVGYESASDVSTQAGCDGPVSTDCGALRVERLGRAPMVVAWGPSGTDLTIRSVLSSGNTTYSVTTLVPPEGTTETDTTTVDVGSGGTITLPDSPILVQETATD